MLKIINNLILWIGQTWEMLSNININIEDQITINLLTISIILIILELIYTFIKRVFEQKEQNGKE